MAKVKIELTDGPDGEVTVETTVAEGTHALVPGRSLKEIASDPTASKAERLAATVMADLMRGLEAVGAKFTDLQNGRLTRHRPTDPTVN